MKDTVFALIRESLFPGKETVISDDINWEDVYKEMKAQAIAALPLHWLREHPLPDEAVYND